MTTATTDDLTGGHPFGTKQIYGFGVRRLLSREEARVVNGFSGDVSDVDSLQVFENPRLKRSSRKAEARGSQI